MDYILEADIYSECSQLDMMQYSLHTMGINEEEFVQEGINFDSIKEKVKKIGHSVVEFIKKARKVLGNIWRFLFGKSKVADAAADAAEKKAEKAVDNMAKSEPEKAQAKARKACSNIMMITMSVNKRIESKEKENNGSGSSDNDEGDSKAEIIPFDKGEVSSKGSTGASSNSCIIKVMNTQEIGTFLAMSQQDVHGLSSCMHDMDKLFKSVNSGSADLEKISKKDDNLINKAITYKKDLKRRYNYPERVFLTNTKVDIKDINKALINTIMTQKKYVDSIQDRLEKLIKQSDKQYDDSQKKIVAYTDALFNKASSDINGAGVYNQLSVHWQRIRDIIDISNYRINECAQFIIRYKTTLVGYLSAIGAADSANAA